MLDQRLGTNRTVAPRSACDGSWRRGLHKKDPTPTKKRKTRMCHEREKWDKSRGQDWINRATQSAEYPTARVARWQQTSGPRERPAAGTRGAMGGLTVCTSGGTASTRGRSQICRRPRTGNKLAGSAHKQAQETAQDDQRARPVKVTAKCNVEPHVLYLGWRAAQWQTPTEISR